MKMRKFSQEKFDKKLKEDYVPDNLAREEQEKLSSGGRVLYDKDVYLHPDVLEDEERVNEDDVRDTHNSPRGKFVPIEKISTEHREAVYGDEMVFNPEDEILEKVDSDLKEEMKEKRTVEEGKEKEKQVHQQELKQLGRIREEFENKHGLSLEGFKKMIRNQERFSNFSVSRLIDYLVDQGDTELSFDKMRKFKKEGKDNYYEIEKENWNDLKKILATYQLPEKDMEDKTPEKITDEEISNPKFFIRRYNLGVLDREGRNALLSLLNQEMVRRKVAVQQRQKQIKNNHRIRKAA